jgi:hypothetical protein
MGISITREERRALLMAALDEASIAGETFATLVWRPDLSDALAARQRLEDATRLLDDLGWEPRSVHERYELTLPPEQLRRIVTALRVAVQDDLRDLAERQRRARHSDGPDDDVDLDFELANLDLDVASACESILRQLDALAGYGETLPEPTPS